MRNRAKFSRPLLRPVVGVQTIGVSLGVLYEGYFAEKCAGKFPLTPKGGQAGVSRVRRHGGEDPHRCERKLYYLMVSHNQAQIAVTN
jgi:hypothetical protein